MRGQRDGDGEEEEDGPGQPGQPQAGLVDADPLEAGREAVQLDGLGRQHRRRQVAGDGLPPQHERSCFIFHGGEDFMRVVEWRVLGLWSIRGCP